MPYLTLQYKLLRSFDAQQDAFLVFNLCLFHRHNLLHCQQVLLWNTNHQSLTSTGGAEAPIRLGTNRWLSYRVQSTVNYPLG